MICYATVANFKIKEHYLYMCICLAKNTILYTT